ncbi:TPA: hypothetical protein ACWRQ7_001550 [Staphylococcus aureus]
MRKIWVIDCLYASTFFIFIAHAQHKKETCQ